MIATASILCDKDDTFEYRNFDVGTVPDVLLGAFTSLSNIRFESLDDESSVVFAFFYYGDDLFCVSFVVFGLVLQHSIQCDDLCIDAIKRITETVHEMNKTTINPRSLGLGDAVDKRVFGKV